MLGKLVDGKLILAPTELVEEVPHEVVNEVVHEVENEAGELEYTTEIIKTIETERVRYVGMTDAFLLSRGYKTIKYSDKPEDEYEYKESYTESENEILVSWVKGEKKEKNLHERVTEVEQEVLGVSQAVNFLMFGA